MNIEEIKRLAFLKYRLSGKKSMNTFIFTQAKNNKLTDAEIDDILIFLEKQIKKHNKQKEKEINKEFVKNLDFICNIF